MTHRYRKGATLLAIEGDNEILNEILATGGGSGIVQGDDHLVLRFDRDFSNFRFLYANHFCSHRPLQRIFSLARRAECGWILLENIQLREEDVSQFVNPRFINQSVPNALRISFLKGRDTQHLEICPDLSNASNYDLLGYVVFLRGIGTFEDHPGQVYEAVLAPDWKTQNRGPFIHCCRTYEVDTAIGSFTVTGVLYAQQNKNTTSCLHAAMRTALSCVLPDKDVTYETITRAIKERLEEYPSEEYPLFVKGTYNLQWLVRLINDLGCANCIPIQLIKQQNFDFFYRILYDWIESGSPVILGYQGHAVTLVGHTFDDHSWVPTANQLYFPRQNLSTKYSSSENYTDAFVLHDDNCGPYLTLPKIFFNSVRFFVKNTPPDIFGLGLMRRWVGRAALDGDGAEGLAYISLRILLRLANIDEGQYFRFDILNRQFQSGRLVLRPIKVSYRQYIDHLKNIGIEKEHLDKIGNTETALNTSFWMVEISCHELFGITGRKFGEILIYDKDVPGTDGVKVNQSFMLARLLQTFFFDIHARNRSNTSISGFTPLISIGQLQTE